MQFGGSRADSVVEETRALLWDTVARSVFSSGDCQVSFGMIVFLDRSENVLVAWGDGGLSSVGFCAFWDPFGNMFPAWEAVGLIFFWPGGSTSPCIELPMPARWGSQLSQAVQHTPPHERSSVFINSHGL